MARRFDVFAALLLAACGRVDFDLAAVRDAHGDALTDAGGGASCESAWGSAAPAFLGIAPVPGVNTTSVEKNPFLAADGTTLYFSSNRAGGTGGDDYWSAHRAGSGFVVDGPVRGLNTTADDERIEVSADGSNAVLSTERAGGQGLFDLWLASFDGSAWAVSEADVAALETAQDDKDPHWSAARTTLYFSANANTLKVATRPDAASAFGSGAILASAAALGVTAPQDPWVAPDGLLLVFSAQLGGSPDLFFATRAATTDAFGSAVPLAALNTTSSDQDVFVTPDACQVWFASNRGSGGDYDLYTATVAMPMKP